MTVCVSCESLFSQQTTLTQMILGTPLKLKSQFRLTYNMILNLLRVEALRVEEMIKRSFSENSSQMLLPGRQKEVLEVRSFRSRFPCSRMILRLFRVESEEIFSDGEVRMSHMPTGS